MMTLVELLRLAGVELEDFKIHCARGSNPTPLEAFFDDRFQEWQHYQTQKNFQCKHVLSLIHLGGKRWLFAGYFKVLGVKPGKWRGRKGYFYSTTEIAGLDHLTGKAEILFDKSFRASYLRGKKYADRLMVAAIHEQRMSIGEFPGFNSVLLSHAMLRTLVREATPSWRTALSNGRRSLRHHRHDEREALRRERIRGQRDLAALDCVREERSWW